MSDTENVFSLEYYKKQLETQKKLQVMYETQFTPDVMSRLGMTGKDDGITLLDGGVYNDVLENMMMLEKMLAKYLDNAVTARQVLGRLTTDQKTILAMSLDKLKTKLAAYRGRTLKTNMFYSILIGLAEENKAMLPTAAAAPPAIPAAAPAIPAAAPALPPVSVPAPTPAPVSPQSSSNIFTPTSASQPTPSSFYTPYSSAQKPKKVALTVKLTKQQQLDVQNKVIDYLNSLGTYIVVQQDKRGKQRESYEQEYHKGVANLVLLIEKYCNYKPSKKPPNYSYQTFAKNLANGAKFSDEQTRDSNIEEFLKAISVDESDDTTDMLPPSIDDNDGAETVEASTKDRAYAPGDNINDDKEGHGLKKRRTHQLYVPTYQGSKYKIHLKEYHGGSLKIVDTKNRPIPIKPFVMSQKQKMFVKQLLEKGVVDNDLYSKMNTQEKAKISGILPYVGHDANGNGLHDDLLQKIEVVIGELSSGNDSAQLRQKARNLFATAVSVGLITKKKFDSLEKELF